MLTKSKRIESFRDLKIWQKGIDLVENIYKLTDQFPAKETYTLTAQIRRAAISVPSNIAEGFRRKHPKEYKQFLAISLGSCGELETQFEIAKRLGYISEVVCRELLAEIETICHMIHNLLKKIV